MSSPCRAVCRSIFLLAAVAVSAPGYADADDFQMSLKVKLAQKTVKTADTLENPSPAKPNARPVLAVKPGEALDVRWKVANVGKTTAFKDVFVHFFVVPEKTPGQQEVPPLDERVLHEGALTMDFKPGEEAHGEFTLTLREPGAYLLRIETINMTDQHGHEHYAAMDLVAK